MNVHIVRLVDQFISHVNATYHGSVHDAFILRSSSIPYVMAQLQRHRVWLIGEPMVPTQYMLVYGYGVGLKGLCLANRYPSIFAGDSGYPNLSSLQTPERNPRTRAEERYSEAYWRTRRIIKRTFGLLKARFRCLHLTGGSLCHSPKKVCQIIVACCMLHNLALRCQVPFVQEVEAGDGRVAAVDPVDSDEEETEDEEYRTAII
ncbi:hypothetical protein NDU88_004732 [Pleurodeles waltl]|uniref:DDE Tnp4 domain-containing protein n=1 Tax=Pleurodeles waltl TaxID=8319 RepID=A0AAV7KYT2_PLEWA|nr:hypothetical protein NDU88_004732 [Pleurodeles waltl]